MPRKLPTQTPADQIVALLEKKAAAHAANPLIAFVEDGTVAKLIANEELPMHLVVSALEWDPDGIVSALISRLC